TISKRDWSSDVCSSDLNIHGQAILYADQMTDSMRRAIEETERRREKQLEFNQEHGITARGVTKEVRDLIDGVMQRVDMQVEPDQLQVSPEDFRDEKQLAKELQKLERKMLEHAKNLEFEQAAQARDALNKLKEQALLR